MADDLLTLFDEFEEVLPFQWTQTLQIRFDIYNEKKLHEYFCVGQRFTSNACITVQLHSICLTYFIYNFAMPCN